MRFPIVVALLSLGFASVAPAATPAPNLQRISPRGLQAGATTTLLLEGDGLLPDPRLLVTGVPLTKQMVKPGATAKRIEIEVAVDGSATAGIFMLRLAGLNGVSNAQAICVGTLPELPFTSRISSLPVALTGNLSGSTVMATTFAGHRGQRIVADVASRRLGAATQPNVRLYNARGTQMAWSPGLRALASDARCQIELPADGEYRIELHDNLYRGSEPSHFRLSVGELGYADFAFPLAAQRNSRVNLELLNTNLPADRRTSEFSAGPTAGTEPAPWPAVASAGVVSQWTGGRPVVLVSDSPELAESPAASGPTELPPAPVGVSGRLLTPGEKDTYRLPVTEGQQLRFDVQADRIGSTVDAILSIENDKGAKLASNDDRPATKDPGLDFKVPAGTKELFIKISDLNGAAGPDHLYRLSVQLVSQPDFSLSLVDDRVQISTGSTGLLRVHAKRESYRGPIKLLFNGLPGGTSVGNAEIPEGADQALVTLSAPAAGSASADQAAAVFSVRGESVAVEPSLVRVATLDNSTVYKYQPWLGSQLAAAIVPAPPLTLAWEPFSADANLIAGLPLPANVQVTRGEGVQGMVRISLITSQETPKKTVKVPNKPDKIEPAVERTIRMDGDLQVLADQAATKGSITVPGDLPLIAYDLALQADLLDKDNKTVVASVFTPVRRLATVAPLKLELASNAKITAPAGVGTVEKLSGKITRASGFNIPTKVTLSGLPKDVASPSVTLAPEASDFELPVSFRFGTAAGDLKGVKLVAISYPDPKNPEVEARSNEIPLELKIVAGQKPPAEQPLTIFEDQAEFVANLKQGSGKATLLTTEKYSGTASCKVSPDQASNPELPGLSVKIRQNPGPGEYRFLRFAWKKEGGQNICIQLAHDGKFGPIAGQPAKFRYHAGPGPEPFGGSLAVDNKRPAAFTLVTRDLFADFGEFTLTGLSLAPIDGSALFDHIYLGHDPVDFELIKP